MRRALLAMVLLCGCARPVSLSYTPPPGPVVSAVAAVGEVFVADARTAAPDRVGAVMGPDGKPLVALVSPDPAAARVGQAFRDALAARGALAPAGTGRYDVYVTIEGLGAQSWALDQAGADLLVRLTRRADGAVVFSDRVAIEDRWQHDLTDENRRFLPLANLSFDPAGDLGARLNRVLDAAIDRSLDRPGFMLALR